MHPEIPKHLGIIMDGNGRWAQARSLTRVKGHEAGVASVRCITEECARLRLQQLTLYAFSSENWKRPALEVKTLMRLLKRFLVNEREVLMRNNVRLSTIGQIERMPRDVFAALERTREMTAANTGMNLCLALSYGGRQEIADACKEIGIRVARGEINPATIDERTIARYLHQPNMPELDLVIRTGGERRISNFLLWQISYSELYVTDVLWPDFCEADLHTAFDDYRSRERRFGGLVDPIGVKPNTAS